MSNIIATIMQDFRGYTSNISSEHLEDTLVSVHEELKKVKDSGIPLKNYHSNVEELRKQARYYQQWSSNKICLDKIPISPNLNFYLMERTLFDFGMKSRVAILDMYKVLYLDVFGIELKRKPSRKEKSIPQQKEITKLIRNILINYNVSSELKNTK